MACKPSGGFITLQEAPALLTQGSQRKHSRAKPGPELRREMHGANSFDDSLVASFSSLAFLTQYQLAGEESPFSAFACFCEHFFL